MTCKKEFSLYDIVIRLARKGILLCQKNVKHQQPNLQTVRAEINGQVKSVKVCTSCLKKGLVKKAI